MCHKATSSTQACLQLVLNRQLHLLDAREPSVRVVIIRGSAARCAGAQLRRHFVERRLRQRARSGCAGAASAGGGAAPLGQLRLDVLQPAKRDSERAGDRLRKRRAVAAHMCGSSSPACCCCSTLNVSRSFMPSSSSSSSAWGVCSRVRRARKAVGLARRAQQRACLATPPAASASDARPASRAASTP